MTNRVKEFREKLGLSQEELAKVSKVSRKTISGLETNTLKVVTSTTMINICRALDRSFNDIFGF